MNNVVSCTCIVIFGISILAKFGESGSTTYYPWNYYLYIKISLIELIRIYVKRKVEETYQTFNMHQPPTYNDRAANIQHGTTGLDS